MAVAPTEMSVLPAWTLSLECLLPVEVVVDSFEEMRRRMGGPWRSPLPNVSIAGFKIIFGMSVPVEIVGPEGYDGEDLIFPELDRRTAQDVVCRNREHLAC